MIDVYKYSTTHFSTSGKVSLVCAFNSFIEVTRRIYTAHIRADTDVISIYIPENVTSDVSGNGNGASNTLQVRHCKDSKLFPFMTTV